MSLVASILFALAAIVATPEHEDPAFALDILAHCQPVQSDTFVGCDLAPTHPDGEWGYAGWQWDLGEPFSPITGS